jgi:hypothetical protein
VSSAVARLRNLDIRSLLLSCDGVVIGLVGLVALLGAANGDLGERFLLFVAGLALILFGVMIVMRWNLSAVRTGMIGLTAGYFATALSEFEVATDPCDIGAALERCATDVVKGAPWVVYQGPMILAMLLFIFIVLEPRRST